MAELSELIEAAQSSGVADLAVIKKQLAALNELASVMPLLKSEHLSLDDLKYLSEL